MPNRSSVRLALCRNWHKLITVFGKQKVGQRKMAKCVWQAEFSLEPGLRESETIGAYVFEVTEGGETVVTRTYETSAFDEHHPKRRHAYEYAEETLVRLDAEAIRTILLKRMVYQRLVSPINIKLVTKPTLVNKEKLKEDGVRLRRHVGASFEISCPMLDVEDCLAASETFWMLGFRGIAKGQEAEVLRVAEWLEQSEHEIDHVKGFILCWIGFNGLYGLFASLKGRASSTDADKFVYMIEQLVSPKQAEEITRSLGKEFSELETYGICSGSGNTDWSIDLRAERGKATHNNLEILKLATKCAYGVRRQVFHEAPNPKDIVKQATISRAVLMPITLTCLKALVSR